MGKEGGRRVGVLGATSLVGEALLPHLASAGWQVTAFSRRAVSLQEESIEWRQLSLSNELSTSELIPFWICVAPIWTLPDHFKLIEASGGRRLVVVSSTSRFTKTDSIDHEEQETAARLVQAEAAVEQWAKARQMEWVILRPTLIYGLGKDKNICEIARFIGRFGFFPLFGAGKGLRQPIHAQDVAAACQAALTVQLPDNPAYNISGGETLSYREMVARVFEALGRRQRFVIIPFWAFRLAMFVMRRIPRYRHWSTAMALRMNQNLVFDHEKAAQNLPIDFKKFVLEKRDLPPCGK